MSQRAEHRWVDWRIWYENHKDDGRDLEKEIKFLRKLQEGCMELLGLLLYDVKELEDRKTRENLLWTPRND